MMRHQVSSERAQILKNNYLSIKQDIPSHVCLVAVSKTKPIEEIEYLYSLGQRDFGENHVQELKQKSTELDHLSEIRWHMIGHLQSNKVNELLKVKNLYAIHSIDSLKLMEILVHKVLSHPIRIFLQMNISDEKEKHGFRAQEEWQQAISILSVNSNIILLGIMGMAPIRLETDETKIQAARNSFQKLRNIKNDILNSNLEGFFLNKNIELSMGMSEDFLVAIEEGSTYVRVGSILFSSIK